MLKVTTKEFAALTGRSMSGALSYLQQHNIGKATKKITVKTAYNDFGHRKIDTTVWSMPEGEHDGRDRGKQ